jgi:hypothetical protein
MKLGKVDENKMFILEMWVSGLNQSRVFGTKLPYHKKVLNYIGEVGEWLKPAVC